MQVRYAEQMHQVEKIMMLNVSTYAVVRLANSCYDLYSLVLSR